MQYRTESEEETIALGEQIARQLPPGAVVLLTGDLGSGKTTLAKGIAKGLGAAEPEDVSSPSFPLIHEYGDPPRVYHVDLYRVDTDEEVAALGLDELFDSGAAVLIEWGERFLRWMPPRPWRIVLRHAGGQARAIEIARPQM